MEFVDLHLQYRHIQARVDARMRAVLAHQRFILGPEVAELEERLAARVATRHCITCASGTDALLLALMALGVGRRQDGQPDEVITSPFTFFATGEMITLAGARPVFVDIEPVGYNIDPSKIEAAITRRTKAILPVSLYGQAAEMDAIDKIAARHGLAVIEDAAQSFGAVYKGRHSGNLSTIGCTSFFPSKPLGCYGEGGALFSNDDALADKMKAIRTHGGLKRHEHPFLGTNGRFDSIQAAVLLAKLPHFPWEVEERGRIGARYSSALADRVVVPKVAAGNTHVYAQYTIRIPERDRVAERLKQQGIPTAVYYPKCLHEQPVFEKLGWSLGDFPVSEKAAGEVLSLPMHPFLTEADQDKVIQAILSN